MSASSISPTRPLQDLASALIRRFDVDGNGSLSSNEFSSLLTDLVGRMQAPTAPPPGAAATPALPAAASPVEPRRAVGTLGGFDAAKLANADHTSFKYRVGRILQFYPSTPAGLQQALGEIQQLVPGARITGSHGDKIDFGDYADPKAGRIGVIDVLQGAAAGGVSWQWLPVE